MEKVSPLGLLKRWMLRSLKIKIHQEPMCLKYHGDTFLMSEKRKILFKLGCVLVLSFVFLGHKF